MRRSVTRPLGDVVREYIKALGIEQKMKEMQVINNWERIVGRSIAQATRQIYIQKRVLFVQLQSSVIRSELYMRKDFLIKLINQQAGEIVIDDIVLR